MKLPGLTPGEFHLLKPYYQNMGKRLIKTPKIYFTDTGLLTYLLRYKTADTLLAGPMAGAVFENMVIMEALKENLYNRLGYELYFYRDSNQVEADLVVDTGHSFELYEIKATQAIQPAFSKNLKLIDITPSMKKVLTLNEQTLPLKQDITIEPWWNMVPKEK